MDFLITWRIMRLSRPGLRQHSEKKVIWYLQWRNTWLYFVAQRFKQIEFTRELLMSQPF
ncbi:hypothetical protein Gotri_006065 [Gossypium trilobum]|uniref:Uncharacterized protein n=1 Tax=Gossypium trilobum TaxID=34281 RepID=A0A7J9EYP8_9ROSI|nr:hypothetical protein [Gossypium trilobum]